VAAPRRDDLDPHRLANAEAVIRAVHDHDERLLGDGRARVDGGQQRAEEDETHHDMILRLRTFSTHGGTAGIAEREQELPRLSE